MNVEALAERLLQGLDAGDFGKEPQFDLRIIGGNELVAVSGDEGTPDLAALLGADRNVLQVRLGRRQTAGRSRRQRVARMHAMGLGIDVAWQRVGVGRLELRNLSPVENFTRQRVPLLGEIVENPRAGRPLTGLGLSAAGKPEFAEQDVAELLGTARVERLAGERLDLGLERAGALREF